MNADKYPSFTQAVMDSKTERIAELEARLAAAQKREKVMREAMQGADEALAATYWTTDDGENMRDSEPEESGASRYVIERWKALRETLSQPAAPAGEAGGWLPIESAPKDCVVVLTMHKDDLYPVAAFLLGDVWIREIEGPEDVPYTGKNEPLRRAPTHWQPLPPAPAAGGEKMGPMRYYEVYGGFTGKRMGLCTSDGLDDVLKEEPNATLRKISKEEFERLSETPTSEAGAGKGGVEV